MSSLEPTSHLKLLSVAAQRISGLNSAHSSEASLQRVKNMPGYTTPVFKGKDEQRTLVENAVAEKVGALSRC